MVLNQGLTTAAAVQ